MADNRDFDERPKEGDKAENDFDHATSKVEIARRLREALKLSGMSAVSVADRSGVPLKTLQNYLGAKSEMKVSVLVRLADALGVSLDWLATGRPPVHPVSRLAAFADAIPGDLQIPIGGRGPDLVAHVGDKVLVAEVKSAAQLGDDFVMVPRYDVRAAAGGGAVIHSEQIVDHLAFKADWVRSTLRLNPAWLLLIEAVGDSMEDTISDGDLLLVNTHEPRIKENAIYAVNVNGNLLVKRIQLKLDGTLIVKSDNPRYDPEVVPPNEADQLRVIGQVVWHGGLVR